MTSPTTKILEDLESRVRTEIIQHEADSHDGLIAMFVTIAKLHIGHNTNKSLNQSVKNLRQAVETERELCANVRGQLDREVIQRHSVEKMSHQAIEWCEHWRVKASEQAQALQEMTEAKDLATDAARFWKARCVCATAALKQITNGSSNFDFASTIDERYNLPTLANYPNNNNNTNQDGDVISYPFRTRSSTSSSKDNKHKKKDKKEKKSKHHHKKHHHHDENDDDDKNNTSLDLLLAGGARGSLTTATATTATTFQPSAATALKHPDLFSHVDEGTSFASNYLYHNTLFNSNSNKGGLLQQQQLHPSHRPSRF